MENVILSPVALPELMKQFREIIKEELHKKQVDDLADKFLSPEETCNLFKPKISKVTLHNWTKQERLIKHHVGGRVVYKYSEVMEALKTLKRFQTVSRWREGQTK